MSKRIFLVHPTSATLAPIGGAFRRLWPEASTFSVVDESLYAEVDAIGTMTPVIRKRIRFLFDYCIVAGADGIVFTGSTFGPAVEEARDGLPVPILRSDEAMAEAAVEAGRRIAVMCTARRAIPVISAGLEEAAARIGREIEIEGHWVEGAQAALAEGRKDEHNALIADAARDIDGVDVLVIGQISMQPAASLIDDRPGRLVLTTPEASVAKLRSLLC